VRDLGELAVILLAVIGEETSRPPAVHQVALRLLQLLRCGSDT
jgi:hypothetical protein